MAMEENLSLLLDFWNDLDNSYKREFYFNFDDSIFSRETLYKILANSNPYIN